MLADDAPSLTAVEGPDGILAGLPARGIHVAVSTLSVSLSRRLAELHRERNQQYVAAPVFGRPAVAERGELRVVVAGPGEAVKRIRPLLDALGREVFVVGEEPHLAHAVKLKGNLVMTSMMEALCESFVLVAKNGVERERFAEMLNAVFRSPLVESYSRLLLDRCFEQPAFRFRLGLKVIRLVLEAAEETSAPLPLADLIRQHNGPRDGRTRLHRAPADRRGTRRARRRARNDARGAVAVSLLPTSGRVSDAR
jgi:3-hydroxyisobutyrate dehydrogenase-like beta-hydroxyacid dehydrogenase